MTELVARAAGHLRHLEHRRAAGLPGRVLPAHADDADLQPRPQPVRPAADLRRRAGPAADPGHRRDRRRPAGDAVRVEAVPARGDDARRREGLAAAGRDAGDLAVVPEIIVSVGQPETQTTPPPVGCWRSTGRPRRTVRCSRCTAGATCSPSSTRCPSRAAGRTWAGSSTTTCCTPSRRAAAPAEIAAHIRDRVAGVSDRICVYQPGPIAVESLRGDRRRAQQLSPIVVRSRTKGGCG